MSIEKKGCRMAGNGRPIPELSTQPSSKWSQCVALWLAALAFSFIAFGISTLYWISVCKHGPSNDLSLGTGINQGLGLLGLPFCGVMLLRAAILDTIKLFRSQEK